MTSDNRKPVIVTHSGGFHADDVFAVATLLLYLDKEVDETEIIRTRDFEAIESGDYVVDVGFRYDPEKNLFDHHQEDGAGERDNGIPYASFGLVWKQYGESISGDKEVASVVDGRLVAPIDAYDNGVELMKPTVEGVWPYTIQGIVMSFEPLWGSSDEQRLEAFKEAVVFAKRVLTNEIKKATQEENARPKIKEAYESASDKSLIILEDAYGWSRVFISMTLYEFPEPVYFIRQHYDKNWQVVAVQGPAFELRKPFPSEWAGKTDKELAETSGVEDAIFCHKGAFMCVAKSKEGAVSLAQKALKKE